VHTVGYSVAFGVANGIIFSSVHVQMVLTSLDEYFDGCFEWLGFAWHFAYNSIILIRAIFCVQILHAVVQRYA